MCTGASLAHPSTLAVIRTRLQQEPIPAVRLEQLFNILLSLCVDLQLQFNTLTNTACPVKFGRIVSEEGWDHMFHFDCMHRLRSGTLIWLFLFQGIVGPPGYSGKDGYPVR